jgi:thymidine kinase
MGPMFAGKSTELLRRVNRLEISGKKCLSVKFAGDSRYSNNSISTHDLIKRMAVSCNKLEELGDMWMDFDVIGIDEGQFFEDLVEFCQHAANKGKIIVTSALNGMYT